MMMMRRMGQGYMIDMVDGAGWLLMWIDAD